MGLQYGVEEVLNEKGNNGDFDLTSKDIFSTSKGLK